MKIKAKSFSWLLLIIFCFGIFAGCEKAPVPAEKAYIYKIEEYKPGGVFYDTIYDVCFDGKNLHILAQRLDVLPQDPNKPSDGLLHADYYNEYIKADASGDVKELETLTLIRDGEETEAPFYSNIYCYDNDIYFMRQTLTGYDPNNPSAKVKLETDLVKDTGDYAKQLLDVDEALTPVLGDASDIYIRDFTIEDGVVNIDVDGQIYSVKIKTGEIVNNQQPLPDIVSGSEDEIVPGDENFEYYGYNLSSIYGYDTKTDTKTLIADLPASGISFSSIDSLYPLSKDRFFLTGVMKNDFTFMNRMYIMTKVKPEDIPDKTTVKIGALFDNPTWYSNVLTEFNQKYPQYQTELVIYAPEGSESADQALTQFQAAIVAGNAPDVMFLNRHMPYSSYVSKGVFADLYPLIDADKEYSREDFLEPVLRALETDGKLYSFAPSFRFYSLVGKTSIFGETPGLSFKELTELGERVEGASLFPTTQTRNNFLNEFVYRILGNYTDPEAGSCNFDNAEFIDILEYAKTLPEVSDTVTSNTHYDYETTNFADNKWLLDNVLCDEFRYMIQFEQMQFCEPITFLGLPNTQGNSGIKIGATFETAILSDAKNPDGAWMFVKHLMNYKDPLVYNYGYPPMLSFPTLKSVYNEFAEYSKEPPFQYNSRTGEREPRQGWMGVLAEGQPDCTDEQLAKINAAIEANTGFARGDTNLEAIISEEADLFFDGKRSVEETVRIIHNRATTYLEESM
jgi:ABC-type glycerol-3-phosphate transport system substrate-binding protein